MLNSQIIFKYLFVGAVNLFLSRKNPRGRAYLDSARHNPRGLNKSKGKSML
jgi:hypothetical protein